MAASSFYLQNEIIKGVFRTGSLTKPTGLSVSLCSNVPSSSDVGNFVIGHELANANGYTRMAQLAADANWLGPTNNDGRVFNTGTITFPVCTTADWGWISGAALVDTGTYGTGNMIVYGALTTPKYIGVGDQFKFNTADLAFTIN